MMCLRRGGTVVGAVASESEESVGAGVQFAAASWRG